MVTLNIKLDCFEYLIDILARKYNKNLQDFTTLRLIKLLFLVAGVSKTNEDEGFTDIFNNLSQCLMDQLKVIFILQYRMIT